MTKRVASAAWKALVAANTAGLLAVALYIATASPDDGPGATPLLMTGLLIVCTVVLAIVSIVTAASFPMAAGARRGSRPLLLAAALACPVVVFASALYATDPSESEAVRRGAFALYVVTVLGAQVSSARTMRRHRDA